MIRPGDPNDARAVAVVHETARRAYYDAAAGRPADPTVLEPLPERLAMWQKALTDPAGGTLLCAEEEGRVVALLYMGPPKVPSPAVESLELHALYVLPGWWGAGLGSALHARFASRLAVGPFACGTLEVWSSNTRAIGFYERRGWIADGRSRPAADGTSYDGMSLITAR